MININKIKIIAILIVFLIILVVVAIMSIPAPVTGPSTQTWSPRIPAPTSFPALAPPSISPEASINTDYHDPGQQYLENQERVNQLEQPIYERAMTVSNFVDKLPVQREFILVTYNIYNNQIYLEYPSVNKEEALSEFVALLKENRIDNIDWLSNLNIIER